MLEHALPAKHPSLASKQLERSLKCDVSVFEGWLFQKLWRSLHAGGHLVLVEHVSPTDTAAPATRVEWTFLDSLEDPDYGIPTLAEVRSRLAAAGFQVIPGEQTFGTGWVMLQARR